MLLKHRVKKSLAVLLVILGVGVGVQAQDVNKKVSTLLSKMTLEEKVGQMTQISLEYVSKGYPATTDPLELDMAQLRTMVKQYHVGSFLNVGTRSHSVNKWSQIITAIQDVALKETRLGIPIIYGIDGIHGASYVKGATIFPQSISMAATFNPELVKESAEITAVEQRAAGLLWNFNPVLGMGRNPLWPRLWETFGEDPYLVSMMGKAYIEGQEGDDISAENRVSACMKHYLGYSFPLTGKDRTPAWIPERQLREIFLPPFQAAVNAGVHTVMVNSNEINGIPVHSSHFYLKELLYDELGFEGFVVSDWLDIKNLYTREKVAATEREATKMAVMAGIDMSMVPTDTSFSHHLIALVKSGEVPMWRIDEAVSRILKVKFQLGLFENPYPVKSAQKQFACEAYTAANIQAARECITLVKNKSNILPLSPSTKVLVTGPTADRLSIMNGGWTITWQGDREELYPTEKMTVKEALEAQFDQSNVSYVPGCTFDQPINIDAAVEAAAGADVIVACLGEETYCETPGNIDDLALPDVQLDLVKALKKTGKPVVLIMLEGRPRIIREIVDNADAILIAFLPGMEGGRAIADVLSGAFNPGGKLAVTYPRYANDLTLYDHKNSQSNDGKGYRPQWPFGFGLSYTTFKTFDLTLNRKQIRVGESIEVSVKVRNTGMHAGHEVVQVYLNDEVATVTPALRRLKGFKKVFLQPGEMQNLHFTIDRDAMSFVGRENQRIVEPGAFQVMVGGESLRFIVE